MAAHQFGGDWTEQKLAALQKYLEAYQRIFKRNERARHFQTTYVDAFAGTGFRSDPGDQSGEQQTFLNSDYADDARDMLAYRKGSVSRALDLAQPFDHYLLIEQNPERANELEKLREDGTNIRNRIRVVTGDANTELQQWCRETDWKRNRAVVFLDPYGMQVDWETITALAKTRAVDLWVLFPTGQAISRLLPHAGPPQGAQADRLTRFFGTKEWREVFYRPTNQMAFLDEEPPYLRDASQQRIGEYCIERLNSVFAGTAAKPLDLRNRRNVLLFQLCFAVGNPKGREPALRIANHIIGRASKQ